MMGEVGFVANGVDWTAGPDHAQLVAPAQHRMHADRAARRPLLHRAGPDGQDRQAVRVGGRRRARATRSWPRSRITTGPTRSSTPRSAASGTSPQIGNWKEALDYGDQCWSEDPEQLGRGPRPGPDPARELVARDLPPGLRRPGASSPTPTVLAFAETYEGQRADLKAVSGSVMPDQSRRPCLPFPMDCGRQPPSGDGTVDGPARVRRAAVGRILSPPGGNAPERPDRGPVPAPDPRSSP